MCSRRHTLAPQPIRNSLPDPALQVPYDPGLRHSFFGEEASMAARMFTRGWDFFAPPQAVVYHLWTRGHRASFRQVTFCHGAAQCYQRFKVSTTDDGMVLFTSE